VKASATAEAARAAAAAAFTTGRDLRAAQLSKRHRSQQKSTPPLALSRPGAGRPKSHRVSHPTRVRFPERFPLHVTLKIHADINRLSNRKG
jgi:hypothetical protein